MDQLIKERVLVLERIILVERLNVGLLADWLRSSAAVMVAQW